MISLKENYEDSICSPAEKKKDRYPTVYTSVDLGYDIGDSCVLVGKVTGLNKSDSHNSYTIEVHSVDKKKQKKVMDKALDDIVKDNPFTNPMGK